MFSTSKYLVLSFNLLLILTLTGLSVFSFSLTASAESLWRSPQMKTQISSAAIDWPELSLEAIPGSYSSPVHITHADDGSQRLFVVERAGVVRVIKNGVVQPEPFLDIHERVESQANNECGLLSIAFPPNHAENNYFFVYYTRRDDPETENSELCDTVVARFRLTANRDQADPNSEEKILTEPQPHTNHNGGQLAFGPDQYLYIGLGDGGGSGDPEEAGQRNNT